MPFRVPDPSPAAPSSGNPDLEEQRTLSTPLGPIRLVAGPAGLRRVDLPQGPDVPAGADVAVGAAVPAGPDVPAGSGQLGGAPGGTTPGRRAAAHVDRAQTEIAEYFAGTRREFTVVLDPSGTAFQKRAWSVLRTIPFATILSYADQAKALGSPRLARAVGSANGRNPLPIVVPCHRVVSSDGSLGGYSGGVVVKEWLLAHERRVAGASAGVA